MYIELKFIKQDNKIPWGFRTIGGTDFNQPLIVVKVNDGSIADESGLIIGDLIVRINDTATAGLTHKETCDLIHAAGNEMNLAIRRGLIADVPFLPEDETNTEIENILSDLSTNEINSCGEQLQEDYKTAKSPIHDMPNQETIPDQTCEAISNAIEKKTKLKKWSTFLVKPKNKIPTSKIIKSQPAIEGEPYRVKIVKQKRRNPEDVLNHKKSVQFAVNEESLAGETPSQDEATKNTEHQSNVDISNNQIQTNPNEESNLLEEENENSSGEMESFGNEQEYENDEEKGDHHDDDAVKEEKSILKSPQSSTETYNEVDSAFVADQLLAVQKQLLALSQLPSALKESLEAVTEQLNKIVKEKEISQNDMNENDDSEIEKSEADLTYEAAENENPSLSENAEEDITENDFDENHIESLGEDNEKKSDLEDDFEKLSCDDVPTLTEEQIQKQIEEERILAKKLKEEEERAKKDWVNRPIILPGGKKWVKPDDVIPRIRIPKMTDEKIDKIIEDFSEVITGKTKGINFLKYQPPPKSLEYLQKSEVYRLIHGIEPSIKAIDVRAAKVLSENDYYGLLNEAA